VYCYRANHEIPAFDGQLDTSCTEDMKPQWVLESPEQEATLDLGLNSSPTFTSVVPGDTTLVKVDFYGDAATCDWVMRLMGNQIMNRPSVPVILRLVIAVGIFAAEGSSSGRRLEFDCLCMILRSA